MVTKSKHPHTGGSPEDLYAAIEQDDPGWLSRTDLELFKARLAMQFKQLRLSAGLTQEQLAVKIGTKQPGIARLESGKTEGMPTLELLLKIATATDHTMEVVTRARAKRKKRA